MTLGQRIKRARKAKGLSLEKLGEALGVTRQLVWQWEHDETDPSKHLKKLCTTLGVPFEYFHGESAESDPIEVKIRHLLPQERAMIEAAIDALLKQRRDAKRAM